MNFRLVLKSGNPKTGPIPVSTSSADTCPDACPLKGGACYARFGPLGLQWTALSAGKVGSPWTRFLADVRTIPLGSLWRHNQAGDLPGEGNKVDSRALAGLVAAQSGRRGWTYTHKPVVAGKGVSARLAASNRTAVAKANQRGFTVNLSADSIPEADELTSLGVAPVVVTLPLDSPKTSFTPAGRKVVVCPATFREGVTCQSCGLCQVAKRSVVVGFPAHGTKARSLSESLKNS